MVPLKGHMLPSPLSLDTYIGWVHYMSDLYISNSIGIEAILLGEALPQHPLFYSTCRHRRHLWGPDSHDRAGLPGSFLQ